MNKNKRQPILLLSAFLLAAIFLTACNFGTIQTGPTQTKNETVEAGGADTAVVNINMGTGELTATGGATDLMEAEFIYNVSNWEPEISYAVSGENGRLEVNQPDTDEIGIPDGDVKYQWNLQFNEEMPLEMDISVGAGESNLDLRSLTVERFSIDTGAGSATVLFGGSPLRTVDVQAGVGEVKLDLTGEWDADANVSIDAGVGQMSIVLPSDVGVIVDADLGIGDLNANGFIIEGDNYVNAAYGDSPVTLSIDLNGGVGAITLQLEE